MQVEEIFECKVYPPHLNNTYVRPSGVDVPELVKLNIYPSGGTEYDQTNNECQFNINSNNLLDPYAFYLYVTIKNNSPRPIQLDGSAHSLISSIEVYSNGIEFEKITDYDFVQNLIFDSTLSRQQRAKRKHWEGFGDNAYGTNETVVFPAAHEKKLYVEKVDNGGLMPDEIAKLSDSRLKATKVCKDYPFMYMTPYSDLFGNTNHNEWSGVKKGKLIDPRLDFFVPAKENLEKTKKKDLNNVTFRIPIMLKTLGFGQQLNNYKLVPLGLFGRITIVIKFNPNAFFYPVDISEEKFFSDDFTPAKLFEHLMVDGKKEKLTEAPIKYSVVETYIHTEQYRFDAAVTEKMYESIREGLWVLDYIDHEIVLRDFCKMGQTITFTKSHFKNNLKAVYTTFTNDLYKFTAYARKNARYNRGVKTIAFKYDGVTYPPVTLAKHNSLNSHGKVHAQHFYDELMKSYGMTNNCGDECIHNLTNFCLDFDSSHAYGLIHALGQQTDNTQFNFKEALFTNKHFTPFSAEYIKVYKQFAVNANDYNTVQGNSGYLSQRVEQACDFSGFMVPVTSKCIYCINFETMPHSSGLYRTNMSTK